MKLFKISSKDIFAILLLSVLSLIFLYKILFLGQILTPQDSGQGDITHYAYPILDFYSLNLHAGHFPLWLDTISTGHPIIAEGQIGPFFPPNIILYSLLSTQMAFNFSYLLAFLLATLGMYSYCRYLKLLTFPSLLGAIAYSYSFVFISHMLTINVLQSIAFLPFIVLFGEKLFNRGKKIDFLIFSSLLALQLLAGFPQTTFYSVVALFALLMIKNFRVHKLTQKLLVIICACIVSFLLCSVQIVPMVELYLNSTRGVGSQGFSAPFSLLDLAYFIHPFIWGDPSSASYMRPLKDGLFWENNFYFGLIPLALVTAGCFITSKLKVLKPYLYLSVLALLFSMGVLFILNYIPPFSLFRLFQRSLFIVVFGFSIVSAYTFQHYFSKVKPSLQFLIVVVAFLNLFLLGKEYNGGISKDKFLATPTTVEYLRSQKILGRVFTLANSSDWNRVYKDVSHGWQSPTAEILLQNRSLLHPNSNVLYGISSFYGYNVFRLRATNDINALAFYGSKLDLPPLYISTSSAKLLGASSVEYVLAPSKVESGDNSMELKWKEKNKLNGSTYFIYRNTKFQPLVRYSKIIKSFPTPKDQARYILSEEFNPSSESTTIGLPGVYEYTIGKFSTLLNSSNNMSFDSTSTGSAFVTIARTMYPGWKVKIDGNISEITNVNFNSMGFTIPSGKHKIEIYYDPISFKFGLFITVFVITAIVISLIYKKLSNLVNKFVKYYT